MALSSSEMDRVFTILDTPSPMWQYVGFCDEHLAGQVQLGPDELTDLRAFLRTMIP